MQRGNISILLPIGEYVLNYQSRELPDTYAWKILIKVFLYLGLKPNIELVVGFAIIVVTLRQSVVFIRAVAINKITFKAVKDFREKAICKIFKTRSLLYQSIIVQEYIIILLMKRLIK